MRPTRLVVTVIHTAIALSTVSCAASRFIGYASKPDAPLPAGQVQHPALQAPVKVTFDAQHVPHIVAENEHDLWFALGYIQARDRLFQMDMLRRMAAGRTSELLGKQDARRMPFRFVELGPDARRRKFFPSDPPIGPNIIEREDVDFRSMPRQSSPATAARLDTVLAESALISPRGRRPHAPSLACLPRSRPRYARTSARPHPTVGPFPEATPRAASRSWPTTRICFTGRRQPSTSST